MQQPKAVKKEEIVKKPDVKPEPKPEPKQEFKQEAKPESKGDKRQAANVKKPEPPTKQPIKQPQPSLPAEKITSPPKKLTNLAPAKPAQQEQAQQQVQQKQAKPQQEERAPQNTVAEDFMFSQPQNASEVRDEESSSQFAVASQERHDFSSRPSP